MCIIQHTLLFRKDYTSVIGKLLPINLFLEDSFIKVGTGIAYSENLRASVDSIPEVRQQQYKEFADTQFFRCQKIASDTITRNDFVGPATWTAKADPNKTPKLKEFNFNKLTEAALFRLSLCAEVIKIEIAGLPECFTKKQQMYHVNKSQLLKIFDPTPYLTSTLKKDALILDFSEIVNYQVAVTTAHFLAR